MTSRSERNWHTSRTQNAGIQGSTPWAGIAQRIRAVMTPPYTAMCYAASEAYYHACGGKAAGFTPVHMPQPNGDTSERHWAVRDSAGNIIDLTAEQYGDLTPDYSLARGAGFLPVNGGGPSRRGRELMEQAGLTRLTE